jgi:hypothetical protein
MAETLYSDAALAACKLLVVRFGSQQSLTHLSPHLSC